MVQIGAPMEVKGDTGRTNLYRGTRYNKAEIGQCWPAGFAASGIFTFPRECDAGRLSTMLRPLWQSCPIAGWLRIARELNLCYRSM